jgi:virginiamycin A acetyltransferase
MKPIALLFTVFNLPLLAFGLVLWRLHLAPHRTVSQMLALIPDGFGGMYCRRLWYRATLPSCGARLKVGWLSTIYKHTTLGENCSIGENVSVGWADIGDRARIASGTLLLSGRKQHAVELDPADKGEKTRLTIGDGVWIGANCAVAADISDGVLVGTGSVVVRPLTDVNAIYVGNPARKLRDRLDKRTHLVEEYDDPGQEDGEEAVA